MIRNINRKEKKMVTAFLSFEDYDKLSAMAYFLGFSKSKTLSQIIYKVLNGEKVDILTEKQIDDNMRLKNEVKNFVDSYFEDN